MDSEDLLNQPLPDDDPDALDGASAIEAFLGGDDDVTDGAEKVDEDAPYESGPGPAPDDPQADTPKAESGADSLEEQLKQAQEQLDLTMMSPEERYKKRLEMNDISLKEAREVIDCVVVQMRPWREPYEIGKGTTVVFQTRTPKDTERLQKIMEETEPKYAATRDYESAKYNIAASIVKYGEHTFERKTEQDFRKILEWLQKIPNPLFTLLNKKLWEFDRKIDLIFQDGYLENF